MPSSAAAQPLSERGEEVRRHLREILESPEFRSSPRCCAFIRHVVELALAGRKDELKERLIGSEVFGRDPGFETAGDPIVRVKATEVRKRLAKFYLGAGRNSEVRVELPTGSYVPVFHWESPTPVNTQVVRLEGEERRTHSARWAMGMAGAAAVVAIVVWLTTRATSIDRVWEPLLRAEGSIAICVSGSPSLVAGTPLADAVRRGLPLSSELVGNQVFFSRESQTSWSTVRALVNVERYLALAGKNAEIYMAVDITSDQLRNRPLVAIGMFSNPWTMELNRGLRFSFESRGDEYFVQDASKPDSRRWRVKGVYPRAPMSVDYALITRLLDRKQNRHVLAIGGISGLGTQVAAEFVTNVRHWEDFASRAPRGWESHNIQILLETRIVRDTPSPPVIAAFHVW